MPGPGDSDGGRVDQRQLPHLCRPFPSWPAGEWVELTMASISSTEAWPQMTNTGSATKSCQPLKPESLVLQLLLPGCDASRLHACHPTCLEGWLSRLKAPHYFLTRTPLELLCPGTAAAPCAGRLLPLWRRRRWAIMEETRLLMMTTPTSSEAMRRSTSVIIHCRYFNFVLLFVILNALALDVCTS